MKAAILSGGSSLREILPFDPSPFDVVIAINDAATLAPWHHWSAFDKPHKPFQKKFPDWAKVDWGPDFLSAHAKTFGRGVPKYTFPMTLEALQTFYAPNEIHVFGVDMDGSRVDGVIAKPKRWELEEQEIRKLDLSRVTWRGRWRP